MVVLLHYLQPFEYLFLELGNRLVLRFVLYVEYRRQVALLKMNLLDEEASLFLGRSLVAPEVVSTPEKPCFACEMEVLAEVFVHMIGSFGRLNDYKPQWATRNHGVAKQVPVNLSLVMADVYAVYLVSLRIFCIAIESSPAETRGADEECIEAPHIYADHNHSYNPLQPNRHTVPVARLQ